MDDVLGALREQLDELDELVGGLDEEGWATRSGCPGWTISDVLLHLAQTNEMATASARGSLVAAAGDWEGIAGDNVDEVAGQAVARDRGPTGAEVHARWKAGADEMVSAFAVCDPGDRLQWVAGDMAARSLATTRVAETWIHTEDVAEGLGVDLPGTDRLWHVARLVHRTVPYAFARAGEEPPGDVRFELTPPGGGEPWVFGPDDAPTTISGSALDLCRVAGQRGKASATGLSGDGPDADGVLRLMRTFA